MYHQYFRSGKNYRGKKSKSKLIIAVILIIIAAAVTTGILWANGFFSSKESVETINPGDTLLSPADSTEENDGGNQEDLPLREAVKVKGLYVTGWSAGIPDRIEHFIELCGQTEINALVIDVKDDSGELSFKSEIAQNSAAAVNKIRNPEEIVAKLKSHGIYTIARIVCFKDPIWSRENPGLAIKDKNGNLWKDAKGFTWLNPYISESWDYLINVAREAARLGFDEVQFDYIRFPTDGNIKEIDYGDADWKITKTEAVGEFLKYARQELQNENIFVSADVFGIIAVSRLDSETIGQDLEIMARNADSLCPMIYPSHYANKGQNGVGQYINDILFEAPDKQPYEVIYNTLLLIKDRVSDIEDGAVIRPYLQDFTLGSGSIYYQEYTAQQIREQIQAVYDAGFEEWIFWNSSNIYTEDAFR